MTRQSGVSVEFPERQACVDSSQSSPIGWNALEVRVMEEGWKLQKGTRKEETGQACSHPETGVWVLPFRTLYKALVC